MVIRTPWASLVSAGFLKSGDRPRYSLVLPLPWMYHCHDPTWLDQDPILSVRVQNQRQWQMNTFVKVLDGSGRIENAAP